MRLRSSAENRDSARLFRSMKLLRRFPGGIDLHRQPSFGEVDLNLVRALLQAAANLGFVLAQQIVDELLARIARDPFGRIHEAQRRGRDDRLLHRHVRVAHGDVQVAVRIALVAERAAGQPRHAAGMAGRERNLESVRGRVRQPVHAIGPEVVILPLLAVGDHRGARRLEPRCPESPPRREDPTSGLRSLLRRRPRSAAAVAEYCRSAGGCSHGSFTAGGGGPGAPGWASRLAKRLGREAARCQSSWLLGRVRRRGQQRQSLSRSKRKRSVQGSRRARGRHRRCSR